MRYQYSKKGDVIDKQKKILNKVSNEKNIRKLTETEKKDLKNTFLLMTQEIDMVCKKYGIKMFLVGGSLLGAVRHGGFYTMG